MTVGIGQEGGITALHELVVTDEMADMLRRLQRFGVPFVVYIDFIVGGMLVGLAAVPLDDGTPAPDIATATEEEIIAHAEKALEERMHGSRRTLSAMVRNYKSIGRATKIKDFVEQSGKARRSGKRKNGTGKTEHGE